MQINRGQSSQYNALLDVDAANFSLLKLDRDRVLAPLLALIERHGLSERVGLRLLHKHNSISAFEIMAEMATVDEQGFALVTRACSGLSVVADFVPNSWLLSDSGFVPVEYSHRSLLADPDLCPEIRPNFFHELARVIRDHGLSQLVGPALIPSAMVESYRPTGCTLMYEATALDERANVLRYAEGESQVYSQTIETFWTAQSPHRLSSTTQAPSATRPSTPQRVCTRICPSVQDPPVHQGTYIHRRS